MVSVFQQLYNYRELMMAFIGRNIKVKYKQTLFGFLWALFMPIVILLSGVFIKLVISSISGKSYVDKDVLSVSVKALPWAFYIGALKFSVGSLVSNMDILKKIKFPRVIFPISYTLSQLFDFMVAAAAFSIIFICLRVEVSIHILWLPVLMTILIIFTTGLGILLSAGNLFFRDVKYIVDVVLTFAIFFTPVFYDAHALPKWEHLLMLNPIAAILESMSRVVIAHQNPDLFWLLYSAVWSVVMFSFGWFVFHKVEPSFTENI